MKNDQPKIDLICNVVIKRASDEKVLLVKYKKDDDRWWIPSETLVPYEHPDEVALKVIKNTGGLTNKYLNFSEIESFRGRTGWHIMFNYLTEVEPKGECEVTSEWFSPNNLPQMVHGKWEKSVIDKALSVAT